MLRIYYEHAVYLHNWIKLVIIPKPAHEYLSDYLDPPTQLY